MKPGEPTRAAVITGVCLNIPSPLYPCTHSWSCCSVHRQVWHSQQDIAGCHHPSMAREGFSGSAVPVFTGFNQKPQQGEEKDGTCGRSLSVQHLCLSLASQSLARLGWCISQLSVLLLKASASCWVRAAELCPLQVTNLWEEVKNRHARF